MSLHPYTWVFLRKQVYCKYECTRQVRVQVWETPLPQFFQELHFLTNDANQTLQLLLVGLFSLDFPSVF